MNISPILNFNLTNKNNNKKNNKDKNISFQANTAKMIEQLQGRVTTLFIEGKVSDAEIMRMRNSLHSFEGLLNGLTGLNPANVENELYKKFRIVSHFQGDKLVAGMTALTANIFHKLKLPQPPSVTFKSFPGQSGTYGKCFWPSRAVEINADLDWENVQKWAIDEKVSGWHATSHFLSTFLHEFMHNVNIERLIKLASNPKYGSNPTFRGLVANMVDAGQIVVSKYYPKGNHAFATPEITEYIAKHVSEYGSRGPSEMYAEVCTQMIAKSLNPTTVRPNNNPFPFKYFKEDNFLMRMMDDIEKGNYDPYIYKS